MSDLAVFLDDLCMRFAARPAVIDPARDILTFDDVLTSRRKIHTGLKNANLTPSHRIATMLPDTAKTAVTLLGLVTEVSVLLINPVLRPNEIADLLTRANVDAVVAELNNSVARQLCADLEMPMIDVDALCMGNSVTTVHVARAKRKAGLVLLTSGSTGVPKMVPITPDAMLASAQNIATTLALGPDDRALHALPMFHIGAVVDLLLAPLLRGGATVICPDRTPTALADAIAQGGATWLQLVPTMLLRCMAEFDDAGLQQMCAPLRFIRSVSADLSAEVQSRAEAACGIPLIQMYGMTETAGQIASNPIDGPRKPTSVGPAAGPDIAILDNTGNRCAVGQDGEVCVKGPTVFTGYEGPEAPDTFFGDWFRTGDVGHLDADGYLFLTGRKKEMINQGGEKISPLEIERAALAMPGVKDAAAYPLPHPTLGDQPGLTVVGDITEAEVLAHLVAQLADYKCPRKVQILDALPRLGAGKVDKRELMQRADDVTQTPVTWTGQAHQIASLWAKTLQTELPSPETDFFDAGGDSLAATTFILELEKLTGSAVDPNLLFNAPTFGAMLDALSMAPAHAKAEPPILIYVRQMMAGWAGAPSLPSGIIRSLGSASDGQPLFWCGTEGFQGEVMQDALGRAHPVHNMMSTAQFPNRTMDDRQILADHYVGEIQQIAPTGPLVVGGFCDGGAIMQMVVDGLLTAGREIRCFVSGDYWFKTPTSYPVFHILSDDVRFSGTQLFQQPELAYPHLHPAGADDFRCGGGHYLTVEMLDGLRAQLGPLISGNAAFPQAVCRGLPFESRPALYQAEIGLKVARWVKLGGQVTMIATVTNRSVHEWAETDISGLSIAAHLRNFDGYARKLNFANAQIETPLAPGETRKFRLSGNYPNKFIPTWLHVLVSDQGITDFPKQSGGNVRRILWPKPF